MWGEGLAPAHAPVVRERQHHVISVGIRRHLLEPVNDPGAIIELDQRGKVGPVDEEVATRHHRSRLGPAPALAHREPQRVALRGRLQPRQYDPAIRRREQVGLAASGLRRELHVTDLARRFDAAAAAEHGQDQSQR